VHAAAAILRNGYLMIEHHSRSGARAALLGMRASDGPESRTGPARPGRCGDAGTCLQAPADIAQACVPMSKARQNTPVGREPGRLVGWVDSSEPWQVAARRFILGSGYGWYQEKVMEESIGAGLRLNG